MTSAAREQMAHHPELPDECFRCECGLYFVEFDGFFPYYHENNHCARCGRMGGEESSNDKDGRDSGRSARAR